MGSTGWSDVGSWPLSDSCVQQVVSLFDHLVGAAEQDRRNLKAERFCSLRIDNKLYLRNLPYGQVFRFFALQHVSDELSDLPVSIGVIRSVAYQTTVGSKFGDGIHRGYFVVCCQLDYPLTVILE